VKVLLEARIRERWCPIRIACEFPSIRAALDSLPIFAQQQKADADDVRMKVLQTEEKLHAAREAIIAYHIDRIKYEQADDPRR
jgi:hypothetical protein